MLDAGIDVVLPDYWGEPGQYDRRVAPAPELNLFATQGIPPMVEALRLLDGAGHAAQDRAVPRHDDPEQRGPDHRPRQADLLRLDPRLLLAHPAALLGGDRRQAAGLAVRRQQVSAFDQSTFDYVYDAVPAATSAGWGRTSSASTSGTRPSGAGTDEVIRTEGVYGWGAAPSGFNDDTALHRRRGRAGLQEHASSAGADRLDTTAQDGAYYEDQLAAGAGVRPPDPGRSRPGTSWARARASSRRSSSAASTST